MIAHVAEALENSGRVVLQLAAQCDLSLVALDAAVHVAISFNAGLESLVSEDPGLIDFARFDFAREFCVHTSVANSVSVETLERDLQSRALARHTEIASSARAAGIPVHCRTLRGDAAAAIAEACSENGPWNVAVLAEPVGRQTESHVADLFQSIQDVTGIVVVGKYATRARGPVVAVVEHLTQVQPMLRAAQHLASAAGEDVHLVLAGGSSDETAWMEGQVRLLLGTEIAHDLVLTPETHGSSEALVSAVCALEPGFVIAKLNGFSLPPGGGLSGLVRSHHGPVFLVR